jgi:DNA-binding CsgD family transcriptional regulator
MSASRTVTDALLELRRLARASQRRSARLPELAPLIAQVLADCQTLAIEKRPAGITIRLQYRSAGDGERHLTCVIHGEEALPLTPSELAVARLLCDGRTLAQIGRLRGVSVNTVKSQVRQIFRKLDVDTRVALVRRLCP